MRGIMKITILGARGSVPVSGPDMQEFGGSTSCVLVETEEYAIFLDAGTGIIHAPDVGQKKIVLLLTHPHIDHLMGLPFFPYNWEMGRRIDVYAKRRGAYGAAEQIERLISPPLWPCILSDYPADYQVHDLTFPLSIGDIEVTGMESVHPGGSIIYRLSRKGKSLVYATDYEHYDQSIETLIGFVKDTDLLFYDGQYTQEESKRMRGFGHSTVETGMRVMKEGNVRSICFVHHDPRHTDTMLSEMENAVKNDNVSFAREGQVITL